MLDNCLHWSMMKNCLQWSAAVSFFLGHRQPAIDVFDHSWAITLMAMVLAHVSFIHGNHCLMCQCTVGASNYSVY